MIKNTKIYFLIYGIGIIILAVILIFAAKLLFVKSSDTRTTPGPLTANVTPSEDQIINQVAQHLVLPSEIPKIVTIANVNQLSQDQPFFLQAKNGDKLLIYSTRVILYNPDLDRIVDIAQIRVDTTPSPAAP